MGRLVQFKIFGILFLHLYLICRKMIFFFLIGLIHRKMMDLIVLSSNRYKFFQDHAGHHTSSRSSKAQAKWKAGASARKNQSSYMNVSSDSLWLDILEFAKLKYEVSLIQVDTLLGWLGKHPLKFELVHS